MKDYLGLNKADESLKKLDNDLSKIFKPDPRPQQNPDQKPRKLIQKPRKLIQKQDRKSLEALAKQTSSVIQKIHKQITKNQIPDDYESIMAMRDNLELELRRQKEIDQAIKQIKQMQKEKKAYQKAKRKEKLNQIKQIVKKLTFTNNNKKTENP
jgi:hypothetical protein